MPGDLSVIGFDNIPESALSTPPLTTIDQPIQQMGGGRGRVLTGLIDGTAGEIRHLTLPTQLVVRRSCRRVRPDESPSPAKRP